MTRNWLKVILGMVSLVAAVSYGDGYVKIGNGDDGSDLEGVTPLTTGPIVAARDKAAALLEKLGTSGIAGLGSLLPEMQRSPLFLAKSDVVSSLKSDRSNFHSDVTGKVFARTLAQPYA